MRFWRRKAVVDKEGDGVRRAARRIFILLLCGALWLGIPTAHGAEPPEAWQDAYSYELCQTVRFGGAQAAVLMPSAVCLLDYSSGEVRRISTCNSLTTAHPTSIAVGGSGGVLYVGHADGAIDVLRGESVFHVGVLRDVLKSESEVLIRDLAAVDGHLYALQGQRVLEIEDGGAFDVEDQLHVWVDNGVVAPTCLLAFDGRLYVGTAKGVVEIPLPIGGKRKYKRLGNLTLPVVAMVQAGVEVLALCENAGVKELHSWLNGAWTKVQVSGGAYPVGVSVGGDGQAYCVTENHLLRYGQGQFLEMLCELPYAAIGGAVDADGSPIVAFREQSVQRFIGGKWRRVVEETPRFLSIYDAAAMGSSVVLTSGHPHEDKEIPFRVYFWKDGRGNNLEVQGAKNAGEVVVQNAAEDRYFVCSDGSGVYEFSGTNLVGHYDNTNSTLAEKDGKVRVWSGIVLSDGSWWFYNESSDNPLVVRDAHGTWHALPWPDARPTLPPSFAEDRSGALWIGHTASNYLIRVEPTEFIRSGGLRGVERKGEDRDVKVRCVRVSDDDRLWVGYEEHGVVFATGASGLKGHEASFGMYSASDPTLPGYTSFPLGEPAVETLLIDYGNNAWIATARGGLAHLMVAQQSIRRLYNVDNSPIPSRFLHALALTSNGTLWIGSDRGAVRLVTDSEAPQGDYSSVRVYPNPVRPGFNGWITIDGLLEGTVVKVADMGGTLVRELYSNGGRAIWDGRNGLGESVGSGVYLLFLSDKEGKVTAVEKIVIVR